MDRMFLEEGYEKTYEWALRLIKEYPNCNMLIWQAAVMLDARRITDSTMTCRNDLISCMMKSPILRMPWKKSKQDYIISGRTKSQKIMFTSSFLFFDKLYDKFTDLEKKTFLKSFLSDVFIYEEEQKDGRILKGLRFKFPIYMNGRNVLGVDRDNESTDETVVALHHQRPTVGSQNNPISGGQ